MITGHQFLNDPWKDYDVDKFLELEKNCKWIINHAKKEMKFNDNNEEYKERKKFYTKVLNKIEQVKLKRKRYGK